MTKHERPICSEKVMLHLPPDLRDALERAAQAERRSLSYMARLAVERLLAAREHEERAA
jgi:predicted transcriptional regulator